jgi:hypothetical protein
LEEMIALIEVAHQQSGDDREMCPGVGHVVKVANLFEVRDFWEWLAPGYTDPSTRPYAFFQCCLRVFLFFTKLRRPPGATGDR